MPDGVLDEHGGHVLPARRDDQLLDAAGDGHVPVGVDRTDVT